jgi:hypothetical protein
MSTNDAYIELPAEAEILAAYEKLFGDAKSGVHRFKQSGLRYIKFPDDLTLIEQNPNKESQWAELAHKGHQIAWLMKQGTYLARVMDGKVEILARR